MYIPDLNTTRNGNLTEEVSDDILMDIISVCIWTLITLLILFLNSMCLVLLHKVKGFSKATIVFLKSMTIADLILGLCFYTPTVGVLLNDGMWPFGDICCYIQAWVIRTVLPMSGVSVLLVTIDRYVAIVHPMQYETWLSVRRARMITCGVWITANLYGLLTSILENWQESFSSHYHICTIGKFNNGKAVVTLMVMGVGMFLVIAVMYVRILVIAQRHAAHIAKHRPSLSSLASMDKPDPPLPKQEILHHCFHYHHNSSHWLAPIDHLGFHQCRGTTHAAGHSNADTLGISQLVECHRVLHTQSGIPRSSPGTLYTFSSVLQRML